MLPILEISGIALALVVSANLVTAWLIDLTRASNEFGKRAVAAVSSAGVTLGVKFLGYPAVVAILVIFSPESQFPAEPTVPVDFSAFNWVLVGVFTWALSGGVVDLRKQLKKALQ